MDVSAVEQGYRPVEHYVDTLAEVVDRPSEALEVDNKDNVIFVVAGKLGLEAICDKILILVDKFKSGYDCKDCEETGKFISCSCERAGTPGRYITDRVDKLCPYCEGAYESRRGLSCKSCKGTGQTMVVPENAKSFPTSGVIVSTGPECTKRQIGERVLFGAHTGYFLPFKGNAKIRCMRENEPLAIIHAIDNTSVLGDFVQIDEMQS